MAGVLPVRHERANLADSVCARRAKRSLVSNNQVAPIGLPPRAWLRRPIERRRFGGYGATVDQTRTTDHSQRSEGHWTGEPAAGRPLTSGDLSLKAPAREKSSVGDFAAAPRAQAKTKKQNRQSNA